MSLSPGTECGPYEVLELIGAGGMGEVYRAHDGRLGRDVALKVLPESLSSDPERLARFEREARAASSLNHGNVLAIYDIGRHGGAPYIVSELLEGHTLREALAAGPPSLRRVVDQARQIASGLAAAHDKRIVHRDLKPDNLFVCSDGRIKILDFGLAKLVEPEGLGDDEMTQALGDAAETGAGVILGTVGYMSPEQVRGQPADARSDIFAFGAILYEMCSGRAAFRAASAVETLHAILAAEPPEVDVEHRPVPAELERIVRHCLEKDPGRRFQSAQDLVFSLDALAGGVSTPSVLARPLPEARRPASVFALAGAAVAVSGLLAFAVLTLRDHESAPDAGTKPPASALSYRRLTFREGNIPAARFAPDGQTVIYAAGWEGEPVQLFSTRVDGPESRRLDLPPAGLFAVSGNGTLALALGCRLNWGFCQGTLAEMPLSGGAPRELLENVDFADWDPGGERLAVVRAVEGSYRIEYPIGRVLFTTDGWITGLRFSPDGAAIAFAEHPVIGRTAGNLSLLDLEGRRRIISDGWENIFGATTTWTPAGDEIWFSAARQGVTTAIWAADLADNVRRLVSPGSATYVADVAPDGRVLLAEGNSRSRMIALAPGADHERVFSWFDWSTVADLSPDGGRILFYEWGEAIGGNPTVYVRPTDGGDAIRLGEGKALALSPDQRLALATRGQPPRLVVLPLGAGEERELDHRGVADYLSARWFPDGQRILFIGEGADGVVRTYYQRVDGGPATEAPVLGILGVLVSPEGERLAGYGLDGERYVCDSDGESCSQLPGSEPADRLLQWSDDGGFIYVRGANDARIDVYRIDLASGRRQPWRSIAPEDTSGMLGFEGEGVRITPDGRYHAYSYWRTLDTLYLADGLR